MISPETLIEKTLEIARRKLVTEPDVSGRVLAPRLGTGGGFQDIFLWDTAFSVHWAKYYPREFYVENSLDNFYRFQDEDGFIGRQYLPDGRSLWGRRYGTAFAPPLLGWAELALDRTGRFPGRLQRVYPHLRRQFYWNYANYRRPDGLFFTDMWGSGMDDIPRWDSPSDRRTAGGMPVLRDIIGLEGEEGIKSSLLCSVGMSSSILIGTASLAGATPAVRWHFLRRILRRLHRCAGIRRKRRECGVIIGK